MADWPTPWGFRPAEPRHVGPDARVARPACRRPGDHALLPGGPTPWGSWPTGRRPGASGPWNRGASAPMLALPGQLADALGIMPSCPAARRPGDHGRLADALGLPARGTAARRPRCSRCPASLPTPWGSCPLARRPDALGIMADWPTPWGFRPVEPRHVGPDARVARPACRRPGDHALLPGGPTPWGSWPTGRRPGASGPWNRGTSAPMLALPGQLADALGIMPSCPAARCPGDHGRLADALGLPARGTAARRPRCSRCPASLPTPWGSCPLARRPDALGIMADWPTPWGFRPVEPGHVGPDARVARPACRRPGDHALLPGGPMPWGSWPTGRRPGASGPWNRGASAGPVASLNRPLPGLLDARPCQVCRPRRTCRRISNRGDSFAETNRGGIWPVAAALDSGGLPARSGAHPNPAAGFDQAAAHLQAACVLVCQQRVNALQPASG